MESSQQATRLPSWALMAGLLACQALTAYGHEGDSTEGFLSGLLHPVFGLDHFLAMVSVGIVSAQLGGRYVLAVPATFLTAMVVGAVFGVYGNALPLIEVGIATSVVVLGIAIAIVGKGSAAWLVMLVVALFGSLHGNAHGLEMPSAADPVYYAGGFLLSTASIHVLGVGIGHLFTTREGFLPVLRHMGSGMAGMGLILLWGTIAPG